MAVEKRWIQKEHGDPRAVSELAEALAIDALLANLLVQRGITSFAAAKSFFRPQLSDLHDPFLMKDMDKAVERLEKAVEGKEKIMVYGDYDVDGTTAVALMYSFLKALGATVSYFIPDRNIDGYGVAYRSIDVAAGEGVTLMVALDCGIKAVEKVAYAREKGIDFIICDHHLPEESLPDAAAVLDPQRPDCPYPYKHLSGCGVGYKLLQAFCEHRGVASDTLAPLLDLVAVSIASDVVQLTGENRVLMHYGLLRLNTNPRKGFRAIIRRAGFQQQPLGVSDIVFRIGPRINAAGRIASGQTAVDLLTSETDATADLVSDVINTNNNDRKNIDHSMTLEAIRLITDDPQQASKKATVLYNPGWHKGVVGIVASRLIEQFYRPTIVLTNSNGLVTGSARSIPGFDLYQAIEACAPLLVSYGGHTHAAGLTMKPENVEAFIRQFEEVANERIAPEMLVPQLEVDEALSFADITPRFLRILAQLGPFGPGNMQPVFATRRVYSNGSNIRIVGTDSDHLKCELIQECTPNLAMPAIAFGMAHFFDYLRSGKPVDVCYTLLENTYCGKTTVQLRIKDIKASKEEQA
ncbi:MAG: single-stranded-DNA-specific exonuclease RecJ [Prevotellaceae bacterium]|jgi:single-stranded-DNA-specific exonuclease|nr:single-stranded-DNA-specific exonuclease RecJ [Prevotellaceae bacterium]